MPVADLCRILRYNSDSGGFTWLVSTGPRGVVGRAAGTVSSFGYVVIKLNGVLYKAHRLAWYVAHGEWPAANMEIDHINRLRGDNRLCNLRVVSRSLNMRNKAQRSSAPAKEKPTGPQRFGRGVIRPAPMPVDELRAILSYDRATGLLAWARDCGGKDAKRIKAGTLAGGYNAFGYVVVRINKVLYQASRIAWYLETGEWPDGEIDHRNNVRDDNRFENLRVANRSENNANRASSRPNTSGYRGVKRLRNGWVANLMIDGRFVSMPVRATAEEAHADYVEAATRKYGEFARFHI